jgi:hypothetical protein
VTSNDWAALILELVTTASFAFAALRWLIRTEIKSIKHELSNNGGSSMKDKVDNNTTRLERVENRIDEIYTLLIERN